jgi:hypothetical protein
MAVKVYKSHINLTLYLSLLGYILAMVQDDSTVGPAVVVDQTQVREQTHSHRLQTPLVTQSKAITLDLQIDGGRGTDRMRMPETK